jgi:pimeloyl-ACP methyl ester carboxylesterase
VNLSSAARRWLTAAVMVLVAVGALAASFPLGVWSHSDAWLLERYRRPDSKFLTFDGARIHYVDSGYGRAIVLIHGSNENLRAWDGVVRQLGSGVRVIRLDLPDYGLSSPVPSGRYATEDDVSRVDRLVEALGVRRFLIGGSSFGGIVAFTYAALHPEKVEGLVLISSAGAVNPNVAMLPRYNAIEKWVDQYYRPCYVIARDLKAVWGTDGQPPSALVDEVCAMTNRTGRLAQQRLRGAGAQRGRTRMNASNPYLARVTAPTLIIWGAQNRALPPSTTDVFRSLMTQTRPAVLLLPGVGHKPEREAPVAVADAIAKFVRSCETACNESAAVRDAEVSSL